MFAASPEPRAGCSGAGAAGRPLARQLLRWRFASNEGLAWLVRACHFLSGEGWSVGVRARVSFGRSRAEVWIAGAPGEGFLWISSALGRYPKPGLLSSQPLNRHQFWEVSERRGLEISPLSVRNTRHNNRHINSQIDADVKWQKSTSMLSWKCPFTHARS